MAPPYFKTQFLYDRTLKKVIKVHIEDLDGWYIIKQVFLDEDYSIRRLKRFKDIQGRYEDIRGSGQVPLIVDCGANIGMATRYFIETFHGSKVVGIEPFAGNATLAERNNPLPDATILQAGISSRNASADIVDPGLGNNGIRVAANVSGAVPLITVEDVMRGHASPGDVPFIIKIDIEGFEADLFEGDCAWIDQFPLMIVELHDWMMPKAGTSHSFLKAISGRNRDFVYHGENIFSISNAA